MSESESVVVPQSRARTVAVDPAVLAVIKDPAAPRTGLAHVLPPESLPGKLGLWPALLSLYRSVRFGAGYIERLRAELGDFSKGMNPSVPTAFICNPDEVLKILRNEDDAWSAGMGWETAFFDRLEEGHDNSGLLLALDFDTHRAARKLLQPAFNSKAVRGYIEIAKRGFSASVPGWVARGHVDFKPAARVLLSTVANAIFTGIEDPLEVSRIDRALTAAWRGPQALSGNPRVSPALRKARQGFKTLKEYFVALAPARRATPGDDLFSQLCQGQDDTRQADEALVRLFITVLIAAYDTTSCAVTSMAYLLAKHPEWQERLRAEAHRVPESELDMAGLGRLEQLEWAWKETLRLMPVNVWVPRRALRDVTVGGHQIAAGTFAGVMNGSLGRHAEWWHEPQRFDPERFSPARAEDKRHPGLTEQLEQQMQFGLMVFPEPKADEINMNVCAPGKLGVSTGLGNAAKIASLIDASPPTFNSATPTAAALQTALDTIGRPGACADCTSPTKYVLLVTDGAPNCGTDKHTTTKPEDVTACNGKLDELLNQEVTTYVIGYDTVKDTKLSAIMDGFATHGGTGKQLPVENEASLLATLTDVAGKLVACDYQLASEVDDPSYVRVTLDGVQVDLGSGWSLKEDKRTIVLGSACEKLRDLKTHNLRITLECSQVIAI